MLSPKEDAVLNIIEENSAYEYYFFKKVSDMKWFSRLKEKKYFSPEKNKLPIESEEKGFFRIPEWNVLQYLEKVSTQIKEKPTENREYVEELLKIIKNVTDYKNEKDEHIDNYRTWWYFVKILCNLPNDSIKNETLDLIPTWLDSKYDTTLQGSEIVNKLLPKFLNSDNPEDWEKAKIIAEHSLIVKPCPLREGEETLKTVIKSYYLQESFLTKKFADKLGEKCKNDFIYKVSDNIKKLLKKDSSCVLLEVNEDTYRLVLTPDVNSFDVVISIVENKKRNETVFLSEENWQQVNEINIPNKIDGLNKEEFYELIWKGLKEINLYDKFLPSVGKNVLENELMDLHVQLFSKETYSSFYSKKRYFDHNVLDLLTEILKNIVLSKSKKSIDDTKKIFEVYLNDNYLYFSKMALYIVGYDEENVNSYRNIYFQYLEADKYNILMDGLFFGDENKHLFNNLKNITPAEKRLLEAKVEKGSRFSYGKDKNGMLIWKLERYNALSHDAYFSEKYKKLKEEAKIDWDPELSPAIGEIQMGEVKDVSPIDSEKLAKMSVKEIVDYVVSYKPTEKQSFFQSEGVAGLAGEISKEIQKDPKKFIDELNLFLDTGCYYVSSLIGTFKTLWVNKRQINDYIGEILEFIKVSISKPGFWEGKLITPYDDGWKANYEWVIGGIGEFIQEGTKVDSGAFDEKYLPQIKEILFSILDKIEIKEPSSNNDMIGDALNTYQGKIIEAFIDYSLRVARLNQTKNGKQEINWENNIKSKYENLLDKGVFEAYTLLGRYLPQFSYLDNNWVEKKIKEFESIQKSELWEAFMTGYFYSSKIYNKLFNNMKELYLKALEYKFKNQYANEALVQHIAVGYLRNLEIGNSIYNKLIGKWDYEQIGELVSFFWSQRAYKDEKKFADKIIEFWRWIYENKYKGKQENELTKEDKQILSNLCNLTIFLPEINSEYSEWVKTSALFVDTGFHSSFFIEYLDGLKDKGKSIDFIGKIYLEMLKNTTPDFQRENIRSIIEYMYQNGKREEANDICNIYGSRGNDMLRDLHEKYNKK